MKELIEKYKRELDEANDAIDKLTAVSNEFEYFIHRTRSNCYRTFITELEAIEKEAAK